VLHDIEGSVTKTIVIPTIKSNTVKERNLLTLNALSIKLLNQLKVHLTLTITGLWCSSTNPVNGFVSVKRTTLA
jgi:hypothetical protein